MRAIMITSVMLSMVFCLGGLLLSYSLNLPSGAVIILVAGVSYVLAILVKWAYGRSPSLTNEQAVS